MRSAVVSLFLAAALGVPALPALAQDIEPPSRVGRVSLINGTVALYSDPEHGWEKALVNAPLTSENSLWTEPRGRVEVRIGSTTLRLDETTQLDVRRLGEDELRAHVVRGSLAVRIRHLERGERYLVTTPNAQFELAAVGRYRIDADEDRAESRITVFQGRAEVEATRRASAGPGESILVADDGSRFEFERTAATPFDDWAFARDDSLDRSSTETTRYVSPNMTGYEDLGTYGSWSQEPEYGAIWYPSRVDVDYVPYRDGRWVYARPWGWTWVDNAPWGYAPFHYGRWVYTGNRWGWCPGRYVARPVWAPALVGWVGSSGGFSVAVTSGRAPAMGWYPLSPYDRYRPWYTNNATYINNVNVIVNRPPRGRDDNHYRDRNRERGSTVVLREDFVQQRPVSQGMTRVSGEAVREATRAPVAANPGTVLPPRTAVQRPAGTVPIHGGTSVGGQVVGVPAGQPPRGQPPAQPSQPPRGQSIGGAPVGSTKPAYISPAPPAPAPVSPSRVSGEPVRAQPPQQLQPAQQAQPVQPQPVQPQPATRPRPEQQPALRARPAPVQPVEVHEAPRPVPQQAPQQAQPPQQLQPRGAPQAAPVAKPAPAEKPQPAEKPADDKPQPQEKPGRSSGGREK